MLLQRSRGAPEWQKLHSPQNITNEQCNRIKFSWMACAHENHVICPIAALLLRLYQSHHWMWLEMFQLFTFHFVRTVHLYLHQGKILLCNKFKWNISLWSTFHSLEFIFLASTFEHEIKLKRQQLSLLWWLVLGIL